MAKKIIDVAPHSGIKIVLDKEREIRYTLRSLAWLAEKHGSVGRSLEMFKGITEKDAFTSDELFAVGDFLYAGLMTGDPTLTPEYIYDNIELGDIITQLPLIFTAFIGSMPRPKEGTEKADPQKA